MSPSAPLTIPGWLWVHELWVLVRRLVMSLRVPARIWSRAAAWSDSSRPARCTSSRGRQVDPAVVGHHPLAQVRAVAVVGPGQAVGMVEQLGEPGLAGEPQEQVEQALLGYPPLGCGVLGPAAGGVAGGGHLEDPLGDPRAEEPDPARPGQVEVDGGLVALLAVGLDHRLGGLQVGPGLQAEHQGEDEGQVRPLERVGGRQRVVGQRARLVAVDVHGDQQVERRQGVTQAAGVGHGDQRVAAGHEQGPHLTVAGGEDLVGQHAAGVGVVDLAEAADAGPVVGHEGPRAHPEAGEVHDPLAHQGAARGGRGCPTRR